MQADDFGVGISAENRRFEEKRRVSVDGVKRFLRARRAARGIARASAVSEPAEDRTRMLERRREPPRKRRSAKVRRWRSASQVGLPVRPAFISSSNGQRSDRPAAIETELPDWRGRSQAKYGLADRSPRLQEQTRRRRAHARARAIMRMRKKSLNCSRVSRAPRSSG